jgi:hypothetical protein
MTMRTGGAAVVADGYADLILEGVHEVLRLGTIGPVSISAATGVEYELAGMAEALLDLAEIQQHLGRRALHPPLWDVLSAPRRYELSPDMAQWLRSVASAA